MRIARLVGLSVGPPTVQGIGTSETTYGYKTVNGVKDLNLYYLATRYYDPETCRFATADSYVSTGQGILGHNRYAYCGNNPVTRKDEYIYGRLV